MKCINSKILMGVSMGNHQSLRRLPPNPLKVLAFVEVFALIILVINVFKIEPIFIEI
jgi:hypothetical protein